MGRRITAVFFEKGKKEGKKRRARKIWAGSRPPFSSSIVFLFFPLSFQSPLESLSLCAFFLIVLDSFFSLSFFFFLSSIFSLFLFLSRGTVPRETTRAGDRYGTCRFVYIYNESFFLSFFLLNLLSRGSMTSFSFFLSFFLPSYYPFSCVPANCESSLDSLRLPYPLMLAIERGIFSFFFSFYARSKSSKSSVFFD